jgi:microsomal epoxide hydrolase
MPASPRPFTLTVPDEALVDLEARLDLTRFPDQTPGEPWAFGTDLTFMEGLVTHWRREFDWRAAEARLNAFPQFTVPIDGIDLHFIRAEGKGPDPLPLLLVHGWPGSVLEFLDLIPRLTDPARFGGDPADAVTVIAPSLPGYTLSFRPGQPRFGVEEMAATLTRLMTDVLGYDRFTAQGGDWGSFVTSRIAFEHPERLIGLHLNMVPLRRDPRLIDDPTPEEQAYFDELTVFLKA